jgi:hypothetical protein
VIKIASPEVVIAAAPLNVKKPLPESSQTRNSISLPRVIPSQVPRGGGSPTVHFSNLFIGQHDATHKFHP